MTSPLGSTAKPTHDYRLIGVAPRSRILAGITPAMMFPLVLDLAADRIPIAVTCRVLGFSKQAFLTWRANPVSQRDWDNTHLTNAAIDLHHDDPGFGYRFISDEIESEAGLRASERRMWRLCSEQRLWSLRSKKRGLNRKAGPPVHEDLVLRDFTATELNQLWLTDILPPGASDARSESPPVRCCTRNEDRNFGLITAADDNDASDPSPRSSSR